MHEHFNLRDGIDVVTFSKKMLSGGIYHKVRDSLLFCTYIFICICINFSVSVSVSKKSLMTKKSSGRSGSKTRSPDLQHLGDSKNYYILSCLSFSYLTKFHHILLHILSHYLNVLSHDKQYYKFALPYESYDRWVNPARWFFLRQCLPPYKETRC